MLKSPLETVPPPAVSVAPPSSPAELSHTTHSRHPEPSSTARARRVTMVTTVTKFDGVSRSRPGAVMRA